MKLIGSIDVKLGSKCGKFHQLSGLVRSEMSKLRPSEEERSHFLPSCSTLVPSWFPQLLICNTRVKSGKFIRVRFFTLYRLDDRPIDHRPEDSLYESYINFYIRFTSIVEFCNSELCKSPI